jgi:hypothetical protein
MDPQCFDRLTQAFGTRLSRRTALTASAGFGGLALAGTTVALATAQEATPVASPVADGEKTVFLFVQSFDGGSLMPKPGEEGTFVLSLNGEHGHTIAFSDRPERIVASVPTQSFLDGLGFTPDNPPNAALVIEPAPGETDIIVLELLNPQYDEATQTLTYEVRILEAFAAESGLSFQEEPRLPDPAGEAFGPAELFIDDCADLKYCRLSREEDPVGPIPGYPNGIGTCFGWDGSGCQPSNPNCNGPSTTTLEGLCDQQYGDACFAQGFDGCIVTP